MAPLNPFLEGSDDEEYTFGKPNKTNAANKRSELLNEAKDIHQRKLESTKRTLELINDSELTGITTAEQLYHQGDQLRNIEYKLEDMDDNLKSSQKNIDGMGSFFKSFFSPKKSKIPVKTVEKTSLEKHKHVSSGVPLEAKHDVDSNIDLISLGTSRLKGLAISLNNEIDEHNKQLDKINSRAVVVDDKLMSQQTQIKKLMK